jgi:predicted SprT family Zn-dependent metalloprotease
MAAEETKSASKAKKDTTAEVMFKCRLCEKEKPISEMKIITRYRPTVVVCRECEKNVR